jgi:hypothetical protein
MAMNARKPMKARARNMMNEKSAPLTPSTPRSINGDRAR